MSWLKVFLRRHCIWDRNRGALTLRAHPDKELIPLDSSQVMVVDAETGRELGRVTSERQLWTLLADLVHGHLHLGDRIQSLTKRLGIAGCTDCERRRALLNKI